MDKLETLLKCHDWYYQRSDDHSKWTRGSNQRAEILNLVSQLGKPADDLFTYYHKKHFPEVYS